MLIRNETVSDIEAIAEVTIAAFRTLPRQGVLKILTFSPGPRMN
jgi:predicted N-acetyltransferase YhbS